ncbi:Acyl-CoA dehydrogenase [anaerobic digester metagenome]
MSFILTDTQKDLRCMVRDFVKTEVIPNASEWDRKGEFPEETFKKAAEMGLTTMSLPEELGGAGLGAKESVIISEELGYGDAGFAVSIGSCNLGVKPVFLGGNDQQKAIAAEVLCSGGKTAFCLTEPDAGSNAAAVRTTAVKDGNEYIINGSKCFITNGAIADMYTIFATIDKEKGAKGICCFLVERDRKGISVGKEEDKMGIRSSNTSSVMFDDVRIPVDNLVGEEGIGYKLAMKTLAHTRPSGNSAAVGVMQRAIDLSVKYALERKTFGEPIIKNQGIQFMLADMEIMAQASRAMVWQAATMLDEGIVDASYGACTKAFSGDAAMKVTTDAVQIFGGYGYSREYPVEKLMRDAKIYQIFEGTNQIQRMVIAGNLTHAMQKKM